ncbi:MAG: hypothetical protein WCJ25_05605 [Candidatus Moraniibacteriota bacterium]
MGTLNMLFKKKHDDGVPPEELQNIRVMQDDIDELTGAPSSRKPLLAPKSAGSSDASLAGNPFLGNEEFSKKDEVVKTPNPVEVKATAPILKQESSLGQVPDALKNVSKSTPSETATGKTSILGIPNRWVVPAAVSLSVLVIAIGAYLFFFVSGNQPSQDGVSSSPASSDTPASSSSDTASNSQSAPFLVTNPNYLQIDIESANSNADSIKAILDETASKIVMMPPSVPVRFLVRDANNNPIAFSRFAHLLGLKVSEGILSNIDETFSLYFVLDAGGIRRSIVVQAKDATALKAAVLKSEASLPTMFATLLYGRSQSVPAASVFHDGTYNSLPTRYANIDPVTGLSFDNAFSGKQWIIGTSKDSFRSVFGQVMQEQSQNVNR